MSQPGKQEYKTKGSSKSRNICSSAVKGSIQSFFNGTAKVKKKTVVCPVCGVNVELIKINEHMDSPECQSNTVEETVKVTKSPPLKRNLSDSSSKQSDK